MSDKQEPMVEKKAYEPPQIIYEGELTTRAGSGNPPGCDPQSLFGPEGCK